MKTVFVAAENPYEVRIEPGLVRRVGEELLTVSGKPCSVMVIADDTVASLYGKAVEKSLAQSGFTPYSFVFPHGEEHKTLTVWQDMLFALAESRLTRTDLVLALGGGVTGDMAGFAAAAYLRGIRFVQLPTTLLAMVDSSVGGKTGLNLPMGKNLAGAFHQPSLVLCDPETLGTLPKDTLLDGVAEAVKMGVLGDETMFSWFEDGTYQAQTEEIIQRCVRQKAGIVAEDELDKGSRQMLNLGHTLGHAIEALSQYEVSHGRAVAAGMVYAARLAQGLGLCDELCPQRIAAALERCGLPTSAPYPATALLERVLLDKKRAGDILTLVLPKTVGECVLYPVPVRDLEGLLRMAVKGIGKEA